MNSHITVAMLMVALVSPLLPSPGDQTRADQRALESVERRWLAGEHDRQTLEQILADDFIHPVAAGIFLTKQQHIEWAVQHPGPDRPSRFEQLRVRVYGEVGIVTGVVVSSDSDRGEHRTVFTDVFVRRDGQWQAVNAQENAVTG
jgi:hypothetical protein